MDDFDTDYEADEMDEDARHFADENEEAELVADLRRQAGTGSDPLGR